MEANPHSTIFLFVNSSSGGGMGAKLLSQEVSPPKKQIEKIEFYIPIQKQHKLIEVYFFDLLARQEKAFALLRQYTNNERPVIGIVCGGDGTIMWVVSELKKYKIDPLKVPLGVLPLGTGNDFSQYLGWGKEKTQLVQNSFKSLKKLIKKWLVAKQQDFDIWDVKASIFQNGKFEKINKKGESEIIKDSQGVKVTTISYSFCNYFSFGIDGKIGYSFDKRRTSSRIGNLVVYGTMGLLKAASKTKTIQQLVQKMEIFHEIGSETIEPEPGLNKPRENIKQIVESPPLNEPNKEQHCFVSDQIIFKSKINLQKSERNKMHSQLYLKGDYYNLVALNINSFMGGVKDIWEKANDKELNCKETEFSDMSSYDGKLEFMCFSSSMGMAMERVFGGFATRITQGGGPYRFTFNRYQDIEKHRTYLQIDGEFIRFTHPESVTISKSELGNNGKIKVIRRNIEAEQSLDL